MSEEKTQTNTAEGQSELTAVVMPERVHMRNDGEDWPELTSADDPAAVTYVRADAFNPDWDQVEAAHESLREHMLLAKKYRDALEKIASHTQDANLLWWQKEARKALEA